MDGPRLKVTKASAGSGKTYRLTVEFLRLLSSSKRDPLVRLKSIVATTFTNKAAAEMRERIVAFLKELALDTERGRALRSDMGIEMSREEAEKWVETVIDNYASLNIRTIDSFIYLLARALSMELNIPPDTDVSFDEGAIVDLAFDRVLERERELVPELVETFLSLEGRKGFAVEEGLRKTMKGLKEFLDSYHVEEESFLGVRPFPEVRRDVEFLIKELKRFEGGNERFFRKGWGELWKLVGFISQGKGVLKEKPFPPEDLRNRVERLLKDNMDKLLELSVSYALGRMEGYTRFLEELEHEIDEMLRETGIVPKGRWTRMVKDALEKGDINPSYALAKLGFFVEHFLIDEFQDTSYPQWLAIKPLLEEALSSGGSLFVVGDAKQSIYGWRGGDWRLLIELSRNKVFPQVEPPGDGGEELNVNRRSARKIVLFNNLIFSKLKRILEEEGVGEVGDLYGDVVQEWIRGEEGTVDVWIVDGEEWEECLRERFRELRSSDDVAVLVRKNDEVELVSGILMELGISVVTESSLRIKRSGCVKGAINLLRFAANPEDDAALYGFLASPLSGVNPRPVELVMSDGISVKEAVKGVYPGLWRRLKVMLEGALMKSPYEFLREALDGFGSSLGEEDKLFLNRLLELVFELEEKYPTLYSMSEALKGDVPWTLGSVEARDAVKVMTVHKAKGLGFGRTMVLVGKSWDVREDRVRFGVFKGRLAYIGSKGRLLGELKKVKDKLVRKELLESLNLLYVAFTRAVDGLDVVLAVPKRAKGFSPVGLLKRCILENRDELEGLGVRIHAKSGSF